MAAAQMFRKSAIGNIGYLRSLFPPGAAILKRKNYPPSLVNREKCESILDKLGLEKEYQGTTIIDMNPRLGIWSAALHERLRPKQHILLEPDEVYGPRMEEFQNSYQNAWHLPLDGYDWTTYNDLFSEKLPESFPTNFPTPRIRTMSAHDDVNTDLLFVGSIGEGPRSDRLLAQFVNCCALGTWVQRFGRVRFLLWVADAHRERLLPRSIAARSRPAVTAEAVVDIVEVAGCGAVRTGRGFHRLPSMTAENIEEEEKKPMLSKRQENKLAKEKQKEKKKVEEIIERLVAEELPFAPKMKGRPRKLREEQKKLLKEKQEEVRYRVESILAGKDPSPPAGLPPKERRRIIRLNKEFTKSLLPLEGIEKAKEVETVKKRKRHAGVGRPRLPREEGPPTKEDLLIIEGKIRKSQGVWIEGMEHPPWYYEEPKNLRTLALKIATALPAQRRDTKAPLPTGDFAETLLEGFGSAKPDEPEAGTNPEGQGAERDQNAVKAWEEYEEQWSRRFEMQARVHRREDEIYAVKNCLLKHYQKPYEPVQIDKAADFYPCTPMALMEFTPRTLHPWISAGTQQEREANWQTFEWFMRNLFVVRATSVISALKSLAPGVENLLGELPPDQAIPPNRRVRCLTAEDLVNLSRAWSRWPFKSEEAQFQRYVERDPWGKEKSVTVPVFLN